MYWQLVTSCNAKQPRQAASSASTDTLCASRCSHAQLTSTAKCESSGVEVARLASCCSTSRATAVGSVIAIVRLTVFA